MLSVREDMDPVLVDNGMGSFGEQEKNIAGKANLSKTVSSINLRRKSCCHYHFLCIKAHSLHGPQVIVHFRVSDFHITCKIFCEQFLEGTLRRSLQ